MTSTQLSGRSPTFRIYVLATVHEPLWRVTALGQLGTWAHPGNWGDFGTGFEGPIRVVSGYRASRLSQMLDRLHNRAIFSRGPASRLARAYSERTLRKRPLSGARFVGNVVLGEADVSLTAHPSVIAEMDGTVMAILRDVAESEADYGVVVNTSTYVFASALPGIIAGLRAAGGASAPALLAGPSGSYRKAQFIAGWFRIFSRSAAELLYAHRSSLRREYLEDVELSRLASNLGVRQEHLDSLWVSETEPVESLVREFAATPAAVRCKGPRRNRAVDIELMRRTHATLYGGPIIRPH